MADDEVEEQMERRRRRTPPKKPCHREPSGEEAGPSKTQPPAPPVLKPRKPPVTFDKAIQTMRKLCPKSSRSPESAPSASVPSTSQAPPTAPDATSVDGGLAASSPSASGGGSAPRPSTLEVASSSTAASHEACELPKRPLDFKRVATGEDWSPQSTSTESPRTPLEVRQMLALRARQQHQSIPSPDDQYDNPSAIGDCSSGGAPEDSAAPDYTDDGWGFPKIGTPDCTWCIPGLCECYRKICGKKEPKSKLVTTPVPGTSPTALLFVEPTKSALRGPPPPPDPDVIDVVPKVHFPDMSRKRQHPSCGSSEEKLQVRSGNVSSRATPQPSSQTSVDRVRSRRS
ncbi:hypothetical protein HPB52_010138 [Rhipicephalus sanguineus]|uniref:Uncharacterized protein n=1 Tax=Rhipicephalus sanguineus TaxID=34632 RepID=A0A9D4SQ63_RHISA|nr:hypothetical protein HPB52_010138 [Rhipicephalus sanguineus]